MLRDVEHLVSTLAKVEGFGDLGTCLTKIIESKKAETASHESLPPTPNEKGEGGSGRE